MVISYAFQMGFHEILQRRSSSNKSCQGSMPNTGNKNSLVSEPEDLDNVMEREKQEASLDNSSLKLDFENNSHEPKRNSEDRQDPSHQVEDVPPASNPEDFKPRDDVQNDKEGAVVRPTSSGQSRQELREKFGQKSSKNVVFDEDENLDGVIRVKSVEEEMETIENEPSNVNLIEETSGKELIDGASGNEVTKEDHGSMSDEESTQFSTSEAQRNSAVRTKKSPFSFLKKLMGGGSKNKVGAFGETSENKIAGAAPFSGMRGHSKISPAAAMTSSKSVFDLTEGFSKKSRTNSLKWTLRKSVSA